MPLSREDIDDLTPSIPPPGQEGFEKDNPRLMRLRWTRFLRDGGLGGFIQRFDPTINHAWYFGMGLVPVSGIDIDLRGVDARFAEAVYRTGYALGGVIYTNDHTAEHPYSIDKPTLNLSDGVFPIIVRRAEHTPQAIELELRGNAVGTVACWAEHAGIDGCITATHVVGSTTHFDIDDSGYCAPAEVKVHSSPSLDASFLETVWPTPAPGSYVPLSNTAIAYGDPTAFDGMASSSTVTGSVTHFAPHPKYSGAGAPMLVFSDGVGKAGDSGALVRINSQNAAMHLSKITLNDGSSESRAIALEQIASNMSLNLYK